MLQMMFQMMFQVDDVSRRNMFYQFLRHVSIHASREVKNRWKHVLEFKTCLKSCFPEMSKESCFHMKRVSNFGTNDVSDDVSG